MIYLHKTAPTKADRLRADLNAAIASGLGGIALHLYPAAEEAQTRQTTLLQGEPELLF